MVWQERSQYIIMLCAAVDQNRMCPLDSGTPNVCPYYWPRARLSPTPTIVQCMDGCSRSGTLVCIEALLMHVLRGSAQYEKLVLTTALFVRLQRRHAIGSALHYLFIYRTLLYWMQPYITSIYQRFVLGLIFPEWGFVGKYNKLVAKHAVKLSLL
uniref:Tyrosine-protein phosphatase domain-containing protein n=1 Tax=Parascaris equorum TaxID=6256 RepID=A0A914RSK1_PAREQ